MKAVILARVSRGERTQDPAAQISALQAVADRKDWEVVEVVEEIGSAWDPKTAAVVQKAALAPIKEGRADVLMVWALDRLVRGGASRALALVDQLENHYGASLFSMQEPFLSTSSDAATRELILPIVAWVAKWDSERKSERLKAKAAYKRQQAAKVGQRARWGRGSMASEDDHAKIYELEDLGRSQREIAEEVGLSLGAVNGILKKRRERASA